MREQVKITQDALAVPVFANIYEQRRAAAQLREQQAQAGEAVMATPQQLLEETEHTAESARRARRGHVLVRANAGGELPAAAARRRTRRV